jgi:hypothetical protein
MRHFDSKVNFSPYRLVAFPGFGTEILGEFIGFADKGVSVGRCWLLGRNVGPGFGILAVEVEPPVEIRLGVGLDRVDRALRLADAAIDALVGMDDEHVVALVEAVDRANFDTIGVFALDANFSDDVGHRSHMAMH